MIKNLEGFVLGLVFSETIGINENAKFLSLGNIELTPARLTDLCDTILMWKIARKLEKFGEEKVCSISENNGESLSPLPADVLTDRKSFTLSVSTPDGKTVCRYFIQRMDEDTLSIFNERIHHPADPSLSYNLDYVKALGCLSIDIEKELP